MTVFQALILGLVQGLTEFLPVSSSGHLVLLQRLLNVDLGGADMLFDITLHTGTLFAVCVVYRRQISQLFRRPLKRLFWLIAATIPAALAGIFLGDIVEQVFFGGAFLAVGFAISAALLAGAQIYSKRSRATPLKLKHAAVMGVAQAVAVLPGISRSGATVAAGMLCGAEKREAADFSFLMSIPIILGGFAVTLYRGLKGGDLSVLFALSGGELGLCVAISVAASALAGFAAIRLMQRSVSKGSYTPYVIYLCLLAAACAAMNFAGIL